MNRLKENNINNEKCVTKLLKVLHKATKNGRAMLAPTYKDNGITLIALVITIIVMLILVAVTIRVATEGNLFKHAGNAVKDTKNAVLQENYILEGQIKIGGIAYNSIDEYIDVQVGESEEAGGGEVNLTPPSTYAVGDTVKIAEETFRVIEAAGEQDTLLKLWADKNLKCVSTFPNITQNDSYDAVPWDDSNLNINSSDFFSRYVHTTLRLNLNTSNGEEVRLLSPSEIANLNGGSIPYPGISFSADCPNWVKNNECWISETEHGSFYISPSEGFLSNTNAEAGLRPVIVVAKSRITMGTSGCEILPDYSGLVEGDIVTINNEPFYVLEDSGISNSTVKLLSAKFVKTFASPYIQNNNANGVVFDSSHALYANGQITKQEAILTYSGSNVETIVNTYIHNTLGITSLTTGEIARLLTHTEASSFDEKIILINWANSDVGFYWCSDFDSSPEAPYSITIYNPFTDLYYYNTSGNGPINSINVMMGDVAFIRPYLIINKSKLD